MSALAIGRTLMPVIVISLTLGLATVFLRHGFPEAWSRWLRRAVRVTAGIAAAGFIAWEILRLALPKSAAAGAAMTVTSTVFASAIALAITALVWGPLSLLTRPRRAPASGVDQRRRAFLRSVTGAMPAAAAATGPAGAVAASVRPVITTVDVRSASVPPALDGLTILHLTDVHLGVFIHEETFQDVVDAVVERGVRPDAIVLTGDIADDYDQLPGALKRLEALRAPLGIFASMGNHEIYRGRQRAADVYADAGVELLCDRGVLLEHNGERVWFGGADDPARGLDGPEAFLKRTVAAAMGHCPEDVTCRVLLAHRPRSFVHARELGVTLTLSGHTHGAQMALFGRSLLEPLWPESFLLGHYQHEGPNGACHLYTSAGLGHWMPFRLNCPCEAALVTLRSLA